MRKFLHFSMLAFSLCLISSCDKYDDSAVRGKIDDIELRVDVIENQMKTANSGISALYELLDAQKNELSIVRVEETSDGWLVVMSDGSRIPLYNGKDGADGKDGSNGKDGVNGRDGRDGQTPIIGVGEFEGSYYWTVTIGNTTTWLLDKNGNKIPAQGRDGKNGADGKDGVDGKDGKDANSGSYNAIKPIISVDLAGYWIISYDNGVTWQCILDSNGNPVKADGVGSNDAIVNVYVDGDYFVFVLANGQTIRIKSCTCNSTGIPDDTRATEAPTFPDKECNTTIPNVSYRGDNIGGSFVYHFDMTGVQDPNTKSFLELKGTDDPGQNIWVDVDGEKKGFITDNGGKDETKKLVDLVFLVDNSGSMSEEANAIARDIISWANTLSQSGLDIKFGCVGYDGRITGAINMTNVTELSSFLNYSSGTYRTAHFEGSDATYLKNQTGPYNLAYCDENGVAALKFADKFFKFRTGANRIYVNFTDENNAVQGHKEFSVETLKTDWDSNQGTVHTVFSDSKPSNYPGVSENPWLMSEYTGGTIIFAPSNFSGVTLQSLPVTGAMQHSSTISITNIDKKADGKPHTVRFTIMTPDKKVKARRSFNIVFTKP